MNIFSLIYSCKPDFLDFVEVILLTETRDYSIIFPTALMKWSVTFLPLPRRLCFHLSVCLSVSTNRITQYLLITTV